MANHGCNVFAFDPTMGREDHNHSARVMFYNLGLSDVDQEGTENVSNKLDKRTWTFKTNGTVFQKF